jgi:ketosteroid isomerase-like protein
MASSIAAVAVGEQTERTRRVLEVIYDAAARGDLETFIAGMHPDVEINEPGWLPYGRVYRGVEGLNELLVAATKVIDLSTVTVQAMIADGDRGFVEVSAHVAGTGAATVIGEHWTVKDGKPWRCRVYHFDTAPVLEMLATTTG